MDQILEPLRQSRDLIARPVFEVLDIQPHVDGKITTVIVRSP
jgi:hypothetical protein